MSSLKAIAQMALPGSLYTRLSAYKRMAHAVSVVARSGVDPNFVVQMIHAAAGNFSFTCPNCGFSGRFRPFGVLPRWNAQCPSCLSLERHRLLFLYLASEGQAPLKEPILHFAPEPILEKFFRQRYTSYLSADLRDERADRQVDIESICFDDQQFGTIICNHVLEHVDDRRALRELYRVLKPGGRLLAMVPIVDGWERTYEDPSIKDDESRVLHFGKDDHVRYYGQDFRDRVRAAGFSLAEFTASPLDSVLYGLLRGEKVFDCSRT